MKKIVIIGIFVAFLLIAMPAMGARISYPLVAEGNIQVGEFVVHNAGLGAGVDFIITKPGWEIAKTQFAWSHSLSGIPQKKGNPVLKDFPFVTVYKPHVTLAEYGSIGFENWDPVYMVAHVEVVHEHKKMDAWVRGEASQVFDGKKSDPYFIWYYPWD